MGEVSLPSFPSQPTGKEGSVARGLTQGSVSPAGASSKRTPSASGILMAASRVIYWMKLTNWSRRTASIISRSLVRLSGNATSLGAFAAG